MLSDVDIDVSKSPLSPKENRVFLLAARGYLKPAIAEMIHRGNGTVKTQISSAMHKLGAENIQQAISVAWREGILIVRKTLMLLLMLNAALGCVIPSPSYADTPDDDEPSREQPLRSNSRRGRGTRVSGTARLRTQTRRKDDA